MYKTKKEISHLNMVERALRPNEIDIRYQGIIRMVYDKNELYLNFNHTPMVNYDVKNLIDCYNNNLINMEDFVNRMTQIVGYNIMFEQLEK